MSYPKSSKRERMSYSKTSKRERRYSKSSKRERRYSKSSNRQQESGSKALVHTTNSVYSKDKTFRREGGNDTSVVTYLKEKEDGETTRTADRDIQH